MDMSHSVLESSTSQRTVLRWNILLIAIATLYAVFYVGGDAFSSLVLVSGVVCVTLAASGMKETHLIGIVNSLSYAYLAFNEGLYGEFALNTLFYLPMGVIGYFTWKKHSQGTFVAMRRLSTQRMIQLAGFLVVSITVVYGLLSQLPGQNLSFLDAVTNQFAIVATLLMVMRFREQWFFYISLNVLMIVLWSMRFMDDSSAADSMIVMWVIFLANSYLVLCAGPV